MSSNIKAVPLKFSEQENFFRKKINIPTTKWNDIKAAEHDWSFMVAGANRDDILSDFRDAVEKAIAEGETLEQFRKRFDGIVQKYGWSYNGGRNWRSRVIYETNLNSSYMAGRYVQLLKVKEDRPYWQYIHNDSVEHPRPHHKAWGDLPIILRWDHPWWDAHFPPNGWGCQCRVHALSEDDLQSMGLKVSEIPWEEEDGLPVGIDEGFQYTPGKARLESEIPPERPEPPLSGSTGEKGLPNTRPTDALPPPRSVPESTVLPKGLPEQQYAEEFLKELGGTLDEPFIIKDVLDGRMVVDKKLFWNEKKNTWKANKNDRGQYMKLLAMTLKSPDEIWVRIEHHFGKKKNVVRRRYISRFIIPNVIKPLLVVFEEGKDGWYGITTHQAQNVDPEDWRVGVRIYQRK